MNIAHTKRQRDKDADFVVVLPRCPLEFAQTVSSSMSCVFVLNINGIELEPAAICVRGGFCAQANCQLPVLYMIKTKLLSRKVSFTEHEY